MKSVAAVDRLGVIAFAIVALALGTVGCGRQDADTTPGAEPRQEQVGTTGKADGPAGGPVQIAMKNVHLHLGDGISLEVNHLRGAMVSRSGQAFPVFDDPTSYVLDVSSAEVSMTTDSIAALLNHRVFGHEDASVEDLRVRTKGTRLVLEGQLEKGVDVPFTIEAEVSAAGGTRLRLKPTSVKAVGIPAKGIMKLFDIELDELIKSNKSAGLEVHEKDMILDVARALPPPLIRGRIQAVHVERDRLTQTLAPADTAHTAAPRKLSPPRPDANYIFFHGNRIRFGKLTMQQTDLQLVDADSSDPFDFSAPEYQKQLVAGYSKTQADGGLITFMPDFAQADAVRLPRARRSP